MKTFRTFDQANGEVTVRNANNYKGGRWHVQRHIRRVCGGPCRGDVCGEYFTIHQWRAAADAGDVDRAKEEAE